MGTIVDPSEALIELGLGNSHTDEEYGILMQALVKAEGAVKRYIQYDPVQAVRTEYYPLRNMGGGNGRRPVIWEADANEAFMRRRTGQSADQLQVQHLPVRFTDTDAANGIDLRIDFDGRFGTRLGSFAVDTQKVEGTDFWPVYDGVDNDGIALCRSGVIRSLGRWPAEPGSVKIVYVGGYTQQELRGDGPVDASPIWAAVIDEVRRRMIKAFSQRKLTAVGFGAGLTGERLGDYSYTIDAATMREVVGGGVWDLLPETRQGLDAFVNYGWALAS